MHPLERSTFWVVIFSLILIFLPAYKSLIPIWASSSFTNWADNQPKNTPAWDCGSIYAGNPNLNWETMSCFREQGFICKIPTGTELGEGGQSSYAGKNFKIILFKKSGKKNIVNWTMTIWNWQKSVENSLSGCKSGWLAFKDPSSGDVQCYLFVNEQELDWTQAENFCTNFAGFHINCVFKLKSNIVRLCFDKLRFGLFNLFPSLEHLEIQFIFYWNLEWHLNE